jgi:predicted alpha/beta-hydrolase family hydrolase
MQSVIVAARHDRHLASSIDGRALLPVHRMTSANELALTLDVPGSGSVSAIALAGDDCRAAYVFAHGAGAGMRHAFVADVAARLAARAIATLRFNFPAMEHGARRPDLPRVAHAAVRAAVAAANERWPELPLFAGGKSFGGRMTSQADAGAPLAGVRGLVFLGFPLHPPKRPASERADHLDRVGRPMLFIQGTRDELADFALIQALIARLGERATLVTIDDADHSFHVRRSSGSNDAAVLDRVAEAAGEWMARHGGRS